MSDTEFINDSIDRMIELYNIDKDEIDNILLSNGMKMYIERSVMYIECIFSAWKIIINQEDKLILYHANSESYHLLKVKNGHLIHHYHKQYYPGESNIIEMLKFIIDHDKWRDNKLNEYKKMSKKSKKQYKKYKKERKKSRKVKRRNMYNLIDKTRLEDKNKKK